MSLSERLKAIMNRPLNPNETQAEIKERIRIQVEGSSHNCPHCGFNRFTGAIHPHSGVNHQTKDQTTFCNGKSTIPAKVQGVIYDES